MIPNCVVGRSGDIPILDMERSDRLPAQAYRALQRILPGEPVSWDHVEIQKAVDAKLKALVRRGELRCEKGSWCWMEVRRMFRSRIKERVAWLKKARTEFKSLQNTNAWREMDDARTLVRVSLLAYAMWGGRAYKVVEPSRRRWVRPCFIQAELETVTRNTFEREDVVRWMEDAWIPF